MMLRATTLFVGQPTLRAVKSAKLLPRLRSWSEVKTANSLVSGKFLGNTFLKGASIES